MRIICQQMILMKYHALFVIFEKAAKFEIVVCYIIGGAYGLNAFFQTKRMLFSLILHENNVVLDRSLDRSHEMLSMNTHNM